MVTVRSRRTVWRTRRSSVLGEENRAPSRGPRVCSRPPVQILPAPARRPAPRTNRITRATLLVGLLLSLAVAPTTWAQTAQTAQTATSAFSGPAAKQQVEALAVQIGSRPAGSAAY